MGVPLQHQLSAVREASEGSPIISFWSNKAKSQTVAELIRMPGCSASDPRLSESISTLGCGTTWRIRDCVALVSRLPLLVTLGFVDQIEQDGGSPKPFSPIFNGPNSVRLRKFIYK